MPIYTCPKDPNHLSTDAEYCSVCGTKMDGSGGLRSAAPVVNTSNGVSAASTLPPLPDAPVATTLGSEMCPVCGTERLPSARFCEVCRYNFETGGSQPLGSDVAPLATSTLAPSLATPDVASADVAFPLPDLPAQAADFSEAAMSSEKSTASDDGAASGNGTTSALIVEGLNDNGSEPTSSRTAASDSTLASAADTPAVTGDLNGVAAPGSALAGSALAATATSRWQLTIIVDPALYTPDPSLPLPVGQPDLVFPLELGENLIGRRSSRRDAKPDIPISDPGVSHRHAKLYRETDGTWSLLELGSTNGTRLNGANVQPGAKAALHDGDQITLGCWTRLALREVH